MFHVEHSDDQWEFKPLRMRNDAMFHVEHFFQKIVESSPKSINIDEITAFSLQKENITAFAQKNKVFAELEPKKLLKKLFWWLILQTIESESK